jgi:hypothetical protein
MPYAAVLPTLAETGRTLHPYCGTVKCIPLLLTLLLTQRIRLVLMHTAAAAAAAAAAGSQ